MKTDFHRVAAPSFFHAIPWRMWLLALALSYAGLGSSPVLANGGQGLGVYFWDTSEVLAEDQRHKDLWQALNARGVKDLMLSFTAPQIEALGGEPARGRLQAFVRTAERRGFGVGLLLGEPSWILPEHRGDLIALLRALNGLPFAGVNLDLEPNQLDEAGLGTTYLLEELLKTLADAKLASPWPVALSIHPRYMAAPLGDIDFATALERLGLDEVVLMTYVVSRERVLQIVTPILDAHTGLRFGVAQSVEPFLAPEESHAGVGYAEFQGRMTALAEGLTRPNLTRLYVQDWDAYRRMPQ